MRFWLTTSSLLLAALCACLFALATPAPVQADPLEAALGSLRGALATSDQVGDYYWLEHEGMAVKLAPAPLPAQKGLALLATEARANRSSVALWRLDTRGLAALAQFLRASVQGQRDFRAATANSVELSGKQTDFTLSNGIRGLFVEFSWGQSQYALVVSAPGGVGDSLPDRADEVLSQMVALVPAEEGLVAPLLVEGAFAGRLKGYTRRGRRLELRATRGWVSASLLAVSGSEFATRDALQFELEQRLKAQGLRRTGGDTPINAYGVESYCGQYFVQGHITRILYAKLGEDYLVAVFHGSESSRELLESESMNFGKSLRPTSLPRKAAAPRRALTQAGGMEISAWQDGATLCWGALFERPWRESGVRFEARLSANGKTIATAAGDVASSLELNPLGQEGTRKISLPSDARGEALFELKVGGSSASMRVVLR
jgi:hypothetical protein